MVIAGRVNQVGTHVTTDTKECIYGLFIERRPGRFQKCSN